MLLEKDILSETNDWLIITNRLSQTSSLTIAYLCDFGNWRQMAYIGNVLSVRIRSLSWLGEGDEKIYIDGEEDASISGTGTESYFLNAWG